MGAIAGTQTMLQFNYSQLHDTTYKMGTIAEKRKVLADRAAGLKSVFGDQLPKGLTEALHVEDAKLEREMKTQDTQYKIINANIESLQKIIDKSIKDGFSYAK